MCNLPALQVQKIDGFGMQTCSLKQWVIDYCNKINWNGGNGYENSILNIIGKVDEQQQMLMTRLEEAFRKLLYVLDRRRKNLNYYKSLSETQKEVVDKMSKEIVKQQINSTFINTITEKDTDKKDEDKVETVEVEKKKYNPFKGGKKKDFVG